MALLVKLYTNRKGLALTCLMTFAAMLSSCGVANESEFDRLVRETGCITADTIFADYQNNEVAAQQKYQNSIIRVCGIVDEIELNIINDPVISLKVSGWGVVSIGGVDTASAGQMIKGSPAVFQCGDINELIGNPVLTECQLITNQNLQDEAISAPEANNSEGGIPKNAMAFVGKYPSEKIGGYGIFDSPDLQSTIKAMPNGSQIWSQIISENAALQVASPIDIIKPGRYQGLVIHKCEAHNCGGPGSRQLHIEYFPSENPEERLVFVCFLNGHQLQSFDSYGNHSMYGEECTTGGFDYGD